MKSVFVLTLNDIIGVAFWAVLILGVGGFFVYAVIYDFLHRRKKK